MSVSVKNLEGVTVVFEVLAETTAKDFKKRLAEELKIEAPFALYRGHSWVKLSALMDTYHGMVLTMQRLKTPMAQAKCRLTTGKSSSSRAHAELNPRESEAAKEEVSSPKRQCMEPPPVLAAVQPEPGKDDDLEAAVVMYDAMLADATESEAEGSLGDAPVVAGVLDCEAVAPEAVFDDAPAAAPVVAPAAAPAVDDGSEFWGVRLQPELDFRSDDEVRFCNHVKASKLTVANHYADKATEGMTYDDVVNEWQVADDDLQKLKEALEYASSGGKTASVVAEVALESGFERIQQIRSSISRRQLDSPVTPEYAAALALSTEIYAYVALAGLPIDSINAEVSLVGDRTIKLQGATHVLKMRRASPEQTRAIDLLALELGRARDREAALRKLMATPFAQ